MADYRVDVQLPDPLPSALPVLPLRRGALLPGVVGTFSLSRDVSIAALDAAEGGLVLVASQHEDTRELSPLDLLRTATLGRVLRRRGREGGGEEVAIHGLHRVRLTGFPSRRPHIEATFTLLDTAWPESSEGEAMAGTFRDLVQETGDVLGGPERVETLLAAKAATALLVDIVAASVDAPEDWLVQVLVTHDPIKRAETVLAHLFRAREVIAAKRSIAERMRGQTRDMQREALLRQQLQAIQKELGGGDSDEVGRLRERLEDKSLTEEVRKAVDRELRRLERINPASPERGVAVDWLEWIAELPWGVRTGSGIDLVHLERILAESHFGLEEVKQQVVEHLAVRKLSGGSRADVLLLVGPPGVGKTSVGEAIAEATGRKLVRLALGGVRDEAELRGHRRTYIGARPGRIVEGMRRAGTADPVILLDEVDKLVQNAAGNPAAALLEILDPEQNHAFVDHYLEVPFDLSQSLFIATANDRSHIPGPLLDRMEVIEIAGYTPEEKRAIARRHLIPKLAANAGLAQEDVRFDDPTLEAVITGWTREAGVRELQRLLGRLYRAAAVQKAKGTLEAPLEIGVETLPDYLKQPRFRTEEHEAPERPGIATGLAWTSVGGCILYIEASTLPGRGQLLLTGKLGETMKESARAALTYVLSHGEALGIAPDVMTDKDVHVHVPEGGMPKDGPSAGITIFTALASLLSGRRIRGSTAMTGEATLRGRVLAVGGIKSKVLAAHQHGIRRIILPKANALDLDEVPQDVRGQLEFILVDTMQEALDAALEPKSKAESRAA